MIEAVPQTRRSGGSPEFGLGSATLRCRRTRFTSRLCERSGVSQRLTTETNPKAGLTQRMLLIEPRTPVNPVRRVVPFEPMRASCGAISPNSPIEQKAAHSLRRAGGRQPLVSTQLNETEGIGTVFHLGTANGEYLAREDQRNAARLLFLWPHSFASQNNAMNCQRNGAKGMTAIWLRAK